ncbi:aldehyde dehydrogenase family protein [Bradyrhizobium sp. Cp5.3]|uniref:aldehyde dehydrogenase family protein n=1 Tax=Bradyrhizobium sp. Cp5.3 TaxID=443598 RepID=UPI000407B426|nr:aldehyde dehydrogenase family protein [Bradyrhizobium sp. Cp5.3]
MLQVVQAFDRALFAEVPVDDADAMEVKIVAALGVLADRDGWLAPHVRAAVLRRAATLLDGRRDHFARQIAREGGKPLTDAIVEVTHAIDGLHCAADELRNFAGREIPMGLTAASSSRWAFTTREPIGVVFAISAFNHPLNLIVHQVAPAIAVGCPVIIKPASATPLSCLDLVALLREAGLPAAWCQTFIPRGSALAEQLACDPRISFLSFIGSASVGWRLHGKLAHGTRSALEHGGVAPAIVDRSINLDRVIEPLVKGGFYHAGQVCVSTQRIFVHEAIYNAFTESLVARVAKLRTGDPILLETEVGPLINPKEVDRVTDWIGEATAAGARRAIGGERLSATTMQPTVLLEPPADARVSREEVFGPVVCVYRYAQLDQAISQANSLRVPFQACVFSDDIDVALRASERLDASAVMINDPTTFRTDWMPFAGRREAGYAVGGIPYTMRDMTQEKMVVLHRRA